MGLRTSQSILATILLSAFAVGAADVPESRRSRTVITRITPKLSAEARQKGLRLGSQIFLRIFKESKELEVWLRKEREFQLFKIYPIHTFSGQLGPKLKEGDRQAPEGFYYVPPSRMNPKSRFHLSFNLGYPNRYDRTHGRTGSALMVHGNTVSIGCFAMTDPLIEEIYTLADAALRNDQKFFRVHIFPFRMTPKNMIRHQDSEWSSFWQNLQQGYDFFERTKTPPDVLVHDMRYRFSLAPR